MQPRRARRALSALGLLLLSAAAMAACAEEPQKKAIDAGSGEAGASSGEAGATGAGGSSDRGEAGSNPAAGVAQTAGNDAGGQHTGGAAPEVETLPPFGMLFSVAPGAEGLADTGVADSAPNAASNLYASSGSGATHVQGTNALGYTAEQLGLDPGDDLDAVSAIHPADASAFYFSVVDAAAHDEGIDGSGVRRSSTAGEVQSDIFVSYGLAPLNGNGSNIEWVDEYRLGLTPETEGEAAADNLNALDIDVLPGTKPIFFSVGPDAVGAAGSAVATTAADQLGCTIFSTDLEGTNEVAFTCAELGLSPNDDIDALVVLGVGAAARTLLFSVTPGSQGVAATAVADQAGQAAADVFSSTGTGTNELHIEERALGLLADDDVDALAVETGYDPGATFLPPPPENPPPEEPADCPYPLGVVRENPGAELPVPNSATALGSQVARPEGRIRRYAGRVLRFTQRDADRHNALHRCGSRRKLIRAAQSGPVPRSEVLCPPGAGEFTPGYYLVGSVETEEVLDFDQYGQFQFAMPFDRGPAPNYGATAPYEFDTFDNADHATQATKSAGVLVARSQDISNNPFQNVSGAPDRVIIQGRHYFAITQVDEPQAYPYRLTFYAANGGADWTMSNVNLVGEPMETADIQACE